MQGYTSIPFKAEHGFSQTNGVAKFSSAGVVLEFESKFLGFISKGIKEVRLAVEEIHDVKFRKGFMKRGAKIELRARSMQRLSELPSSEGKVSLKIEADDFERAREAVERLQKELDEHAASLPPPHTSIASIIDGSEDDTEELK
jgi:hypothetical protein